MAKRREYPDDDGRTIVDMSGVEDVNRIRFVPHTREQKMNTEEDHSPPAEPISKEERRLYVFAALRAALLIGGVFLAGIALTIWLLLRLWT